MHDSPPNTSPAIVPGDAVSCFEAVMLLVADRPGPREDAAGFHQRTAGAELSATGL